MIFLPYRMDSQKTGVPLFTLLIIVVCIVVYWQQYNSHKQHVLKANRYCHSLESETQTVLQNITNKTQPAKYCYEFFQEIQLSQVTDSLTEIVKQARPTGLYPNKEQDFAYQYHRALTAFTGFKEAVPANLTDKLVYKPGSTDIGAMLTSTVSHGSVAHLVGNLLFFYIFAASVELVLGSLVFAALALTFSVGTSLAYGYVASASGVDIPTIGLSGVVMAMIALLATMMPQAKIRCFFWLLVIVKIIRIPAIVLALWYIGWDFYEYYQLGLSSPINYVAHVAGALMGLLIGLIFRIHYSKKIEDAAFYY